MSRIRTTDVACGSGRLVTCTPADAQAFLLLGHGAGGGIDSFDLEALADLLPEAGIAVGRYEQPWRTAGRKIAGSPASLDLAWADALAAVPTDLPLVVGGRSAGARVACRCHAAPVLGVVALSFPLHPPGRPEKSRAAELAGVGAPVLVVQGEKDPMGTPEEIRATFDGRDDRVVVVVHGATHSLKPTRKADDPAERAQLLGDAVAGFVRAIVRG